jgi:hypothetical protein
MTTPESQYPLGSDPTELERLDHQGRMLEPPTRMLLEAAGIREGCACGSRSATSRSRRRGARTTPSSRVSC